MSNSLLLSRRSFMIMPLALAACKTGWSVLELSGLTMGTGYNIVAVDHSKAVNKAELQAAVDAALADVNTQMSNWDASSEISRFNALAKGESLTVSAELAEVMAAAADVNRASQGRFDVTVGALIDLWGFGAGQSPKTAAPSETAILDAMGCCGQAQSIAQAGTTLTKTQDGAEVYLSAIGKGFGVDHVARALASFGITDYMVEIGGDLVTAGRNPEGLPWQIGIETPSSFDRGVMQVVGLSDLGMATSGDYRNYFEADGERFSHIIDATTGRPVTHNTASVTVLTDNAMLADAWATALLVLGTEKGLEIANSRDMAVLFVDRTGAEATSDVTTTASRKFLELTA
ncbi:FAD:protein FMN transferase [Pacificoceanicola onchidii]|uniref:FAD:protein FMN transferase n=1 Tax=Pacificoceanicola onchidii TaxID=2562685 RepID=UPI0010A66ADC|nr:FAD:protein FMN transferase [Pacificoceanicola onchidii]